MSKILASQSTSQPASAPTGQPTSLPAASQPVTQPQPTVLPETLESKPTPPTAIQSPVPALTEVPAPTESSNLLAHSGETDKAADFEAISSRWLALARKIMAAGLTLQGLYNLSKQVMFVFAGIPELEQKLAQGLIDRQEITALSAKAVLEVMTSLLSLFLAFQLTKVRKATAGKIQLAVAVLLFFGNAFLLNYLSSHFELDVLLADWTQSLFAAILSLPRRL